MKRTKLLKSLSFQADQDKDNHERWLLTYADMITLLLGLFIVLYAISKVDQKKLNEVASDIRKGFGVRASSQVLLIEGGAGILESDTMEPKSVLFRLWERVGYALKSLKNQTKLKLGLAETEELKLTFFLSGLDQEKAFEKDPDLSFAFTQLSELSKDLDLEFVIRVQIPYGSQLDQSKFQNAWDFHAHKASIIAESLSKKYGIAESKIAVQGYATFQKSAGSDTPEKRAKEERIEILVRKRENSNP